MAVLHPESTVDPDEIQSKICEWSIERVDRVTVAGNLYCVDLATQIDHMTLGPNDFRIAGMVFADRWRIMLARSKLDLGFQIDHMMRGCVHPRHERPVDIIQDKLRINTSMVGADHIPLPVCPLCCARP